jgi:hypothetical protein
MLRLFRRGISNNQEDADCRNDIDHIFILAAQVGSLTHLLLGFISNIGNSKTLGFQRIGS